MAWPILKKINNGAENLDPIDCVNALSIVIKSDRFGEFVVFSKSSEYGLDILHSLAITESIFTPLVTGKLLVFDRGNFVENLNLQGFEDLILKYRKAEDEVVFNGIIIDINLLTNDAIIASKMNSKQRVRLYSMSFMNKDLFFANFNNLHEIPQRRFAGPFVAQDSTEFVNKDFIGWISKLNN